MKLLEYKGYHAKIEYEINDKTFVGTVIGVSDSLNFNCDDSKNVEKMFHQCIDNYLDVCGQIGKEPDKEYTGQFNVRIPSEIHKKLVLEATDNDMSLNSLITKICEDHINNNGFAQISINNLFYNAGYDDEKDITNMISLQMGGSYNGKYTN